MVRCVCLRVLVSVKVTRVVCIGVPCMRQFFFCRMRALRRLQVCMYIAKTLAAFM